MDSSPVRTLNTNDISRQPTTGRDGETWIAAKSWWRIFIETETRLPPLGESYGYPMTIYRSLCTAVMIISLAATSSGQDRLKRYLNIVAPQTALRAPILLTLNGKTTLFGLFERVHGRDVSAMLLNGKKWQPLGENGLAISGVGGNFLSCVAVDASGSPWILTYYTRPSNPVRADRFFLYNLRRNHWTLVGPQDGLKADFSGNASLHLRAGTTPVLTYKSFDRDAGSYEQRVFVLQEDKWNQSDFARHIPNDSVVLTSQNQAFVVRVGNGMVSVHEFPDASVNAFPQPKYIIGFPRDQRFDRLYFDRGKPAALLTSDSEAKRSFLRYSDRHDGTDLEELPLPDDHSLIGIRWNQGGQMIVATDDSETAGIYRRTSDSWVLVASARETSGAVLFSPFFTILDDGKPIVTWEAFFPH